MVSTTASRRDLGTHGVSIIRLLPITTILVGPASHLSDRLLVGEHLQQEELTVFSYTCLSSPLAIKSLLLLAVAIFLPSLVSAADYEFWIGAIGINKTRSLHLDSNVAALTVNGSADVIQYTRTVTLGDQGGSNHVILYYTDSNLGVSFSANPATDTVDISYSILNSASTGASNGIPFLSLPSQAFC